MMRHLTHFSLKRNCTDNILQILSKSSKSSLQVLSLPLYIKVYNFNSQCLDVENSRDVTDNGVQYICIFKVKSSSFDRSDFDECPRHFSCLHWTSSTAVWVWRVWRPSYKPTIHWGNWRGEFLSVKHSATKLWSMKQPGLIKRNWSCKYFRPRRKYISIQMRRWHS